MFFELLFILIQLCNLEAKFLFEFVYFALVLGAYFCHHHLVVAFATVLQKNLEDFPQ